MSLLIYTDTETEKPATLKCVLQTFAQLLQQLGFPCTCLEVICLGEVGEKGWALLPPPPARLPGQAVSPPAAGCPLLCPQPCLSLSMPTPAHSSGQSTRATATGTSPSTKPGLKPTSTAPSSPLASDQPSWPPSTGEGCRDMSPQLAQPGEKRSGRQSPIPTSQPLCQLQAYVPACTSLCSRGPVKADAQVTPRQYRKQILFPGLAGKLA